MYSKAGLLTRPSQLWEKGREGNVCYVALALRFINLLLRRLCGWLRACLIRRSGLLLRGSLGACLIVPREFVVDGSHFKGHFISRIEQYRGRGLQRIHLVIPCIGAQTAAQWKSGDLIQLVLIQFGSALVW